MTERNIRLSLAFTPARLAMLLALPALGVLATLDAWQDIAHIATRDEESSHVLLVPLVVAWLVWVRRRLLVHCRLGGTWVGPLLVLLGLACYCVGDRMLIQVLWHGGAVLVFLGCVFGLLGRDALRYFLPAALAVLFVVPVPGRVRQRVAIPMETATAQVTQRVYETMGVPIERSANTLRLNGRDVDIVEACNGLRMVVALTLVSFTFAFGTPLRWYVRLLILALSPLSAILCNVVRLLPTVWIYGYYPGQFATLFHDISGWVMLFVSLLMLLGVIRTLRWALVPVNTYVLAYD